MHIWLRFFKYSPIYFAPANIVPVNSLHIGPGDNLQLIFMELKRKEEVTVHRDGTFNLPFIGPVNLQV